VKNLNAYSYFCSGLDAAFDSPTPIVALGFQLANGKISSDHEGKPLIADLFDDPAFSIARH
jgi:fructose 1,6-bisphosphatase